MGKWQREGLEWDREKGQKENGREGEGPR